MRKVLFIVLIALVSCKSKEQIEQEKREKAKQEAMEMVNKISAPLIANEVGDMNILISAAENTNLSRDERQNAYSELRQKYCGYLCQVNVVVDSLQSSEEFKQAVVKQKELIEAKWKNEAAKQVYTNALQHQQELQQDINH
jgi:uncharacterized protein YjgD (DUF1641 family)